MSVWRGQGSSCWERREFEDMVVGMSFRCLLSLFDLQLVNMVTGGCGICGNTHKCSYSRNC